MRPILPVVAALVIVPVVAHADRLITIPTGTKILYGAFKIETLFRQGIPAHRRDSIAFGLSPTMDFEITNDMRDPVRHGTTFDMSYNLMFAVPDVAPALSIGIRDALEKTHDGRGAYIAATFKYGQFGDINSDVPAEVTIGGGGGAFRGAFVGFMLPFSWQFRLIAEHDSRRLTAGVEIQPVKGMYLRWVHRQDESLVGFGFSKRF